MLAESGPSPPGGMRKGLLTVCVWGVCVGGGWVRRLQAGSLKALEASWKEGPSREEPPPPVHLKEGWVV